MLIQEHVDHINGWLDSLIIAHLLLLLSCILLFSILLFLPLFVLLLFVVVDLWWHGLRLLKRLIDAVVEDRLSQLLKAGVVYYLDVVVMVTWDGFFFVAVEVDWLELRLGVLVLLSHAKPHELFVLALVLILMHHLGLRHIKTHLNAAVLDLRLVYVLELRSGLLSSLLGLQLLLLLAFTLFLTLKEGLVLHPLLLYFSIESLLGFFFLHLLVFFVLKLSLLLAYNVI